MIQKRSKQCIASLLILLSGPIKAEISFSVYGRSLGPGLSVCRRPRSSWSAVCETVFRTSSFCCNEASTAQSNLNIIVARLDEDLLFATANLHYPGQTICVTSRTGLGIRNLVKACWRMFSIWMCLFRGICKGSF